MCQTAGVQKFEKACQFPGDTSLQPKWGGWAWTTPDPAAIVRAGFNWFEVGYPGTLTAAQYQTLRDGGVRPFAYINMAEIPNDDTYLQGQIDAVLGFSHTQLPTIKQNTDWNSTVIDVRNADWQRWLIARANEAYNRGARGVKWDVAGIEGMYSDSTAGQQALDAMGTMMMNLNQQHPDMKQYVNQGYGLANRYPAVVDGLETENMVQGALWNSDPGMVQWFHEEEAKWNYVHDQFGIPILMAEYRDNPADSTSATLEQQIEAWGLTPYVTNVQWNIQGRGLHIVPPW